MTLTKTEERRQVALQLAIKSSDTAVKTDTILARAAAFDRFLTGGEVVAP